MIPCTSQIFEQVANANKYTLRFAYSVEDDVREAFKVTSGCAVFVYASPRFVNDKYDKKRARYPGKHLDEGALTKFAKKKALPLVGQRTWKSSDLYESTGLPVLTLFTNVRADAHLWSTAFLTSPSDRSGEELQGLRLLRKQTSSCGPGALTPLCKVATVIT